MIERLDYEKTTLEEFDRELDDLLPWQDADSATAERLESEAFMSMMALNT